MSEWAGEGAFALYGAAVGAVLGFGLSGLEGAIRRRREKCARARYLAIRVVIAIDRFVGSCADALRAEVHPLDYDTDPETHAPMPEQYREPEGVDWSSIDNLLAFQVLSLPARDHQARLQIRDLYQYQSGVRPLRDDLFARLALDANSLAERLRSDYGVPQRADGETVTLTWLKSFAEKLGPVSEDPHR